MTTQTQPAPAEPAATQDVVLRAEGLVKRYGHVTAMDGADFDLRRGEVARQVREYRKRYPDKAILCSLPGASGWAVLAGGGSILNLPRLKDERLLWALPRMKPFEPGTPLAEGQWAVAEPGQHYLVYSAGPGKVRLDLGRDRTAYQVRPIDPRHRHTAQDDQAHRLPPPRLAGVPLSRAPAPSSPRARRRSPVLDPHPHVRTSASPR